MEGYASIVFEIVHAVEKFTKLKDGMGPDTLLLGLHQDQFLTAYVNDTWMHHCDEGISSVHGSEFEGMKVRVIDREDDLIEVAITNWRSL